MRSLLILLLTTTSLYGQTILSSPYLFEQSHFGSYLSSSENHLVVSVDHPEEIKDSIYIYEKTAAGTWRYQQNIYISDPRSPSSPTVSDIKGNELVIGNGSISGNGAAYEGKVYYYRLQNGSWQLEQKITAPSPQSWELFGHSISFYGDYLAVGAVGFSTYNVNASVYIYKKINGQWNFQQKLQSSNPSSNTSYGFHLDMFGKYLVVNAPQESTDANGNNPVSQAGAAYLYERNPDGTWVEIQKLVSRKRSAAGGFSLNVAISDEHLALAYPFDGYDEQDQNYLRRSGSVYLYRKISNQWQFQKKLVLNQRNTDDCFGYSLVLFGDSLLVNSRRDIMSSLAPNNYTEVRDIVSLFDLNSYTTIWQDTITSYEKNRILVDAPVSLNSSGLFVSQVGFDTAGIGNAGAVYYYPRHSVGMRERLVENDLSFFPNPVKEYINITLPPGYSSRDKLLLRIISLDGQVLKNQKLINNPHKSKYEILLNELQPGMYILQLSDGESSMQASFLKAAD